MWNHVNLNSCFTTAQPHAELRPAGPPSMLSAVGPAVGALHLPVGGVAFLHPLPQEEQQRLHHDVYIKPSQNGKRCERLPENVIRDCVLSA